MRTLLDSVEAAAGASARTMQAAARTVFLRSFMMFLGSSARDRAGSRMRLLVPEPLRPGEWFLPIAVPLAHPVHEPCSPVAVCDWPRLRSDLFMQEKVGREQHKIVTLLVSVLLLRADWFVVTIDTPKGMRLTYSGSCTYIYPSKE